MALFVFGFAKGGRVVSALAGWNAWFDAFGFQSRAIRIGVIALVTDHHTARCVRQSRVEDFRANMGGGLSGCQAHSEGTPFAVTNGVQFGIQAAFCGPDMAGKNPPFSKLDAVRCAFRCVASIINVPGGPPFAAK